MKIGIDLGTANIIVYVKGHGIVMQEPSVVAVDDQNHIVAVGEEAREMIGRTPGNIQAIRPMRDGVIADYVITEALLDHFIHRVQQGRRFGWGKPEVMISVPAGVTITGPAMESLHTEHWGVLPGFGSPVSNSLAPGHPDRPGGQAPSDPSHICVICLQIGDRGTSAPSFCQILPTRAVSRIAPPVSPSGTVAPRHFFPCKRGPPPPLA